MLRELAELTMLEEGDPQSFRVRAYESAAQAINAEASDLGRLTVKELHRTLRALLTLLQQRQLELASLTTHHATLDDVFVSLTGRQLRDT